MSKITFEGKLTEDHVDVEDGGLAMIAEPDWKVEGGDDKIFVRIQSWDESIENNPMYDYEDSREVRAKLGHESMHSLIGKKIRVTIEVIEE